ncbi:MAG: metallophosphoesterase family protein, partial [Thermoguttaceae bacterium]
VDNIFGSRDKAPDPWGATLGKTQYDWLKKTLETSQKRFKFVFAHHVNGRGRGGVECAPFYEWGGSDARGKSLFAQKRPGWEMPIHDLFVKNKVSVFFQGHDHIFAKQEKDGVIYQTLPLPGDSNGVLYNDEAFTSGVKFPGSGLLKVSVSPEKVCVEYLKRERDIQSSIFSYDVR